MLIALLMPPVNAIGISPPSFEIQYEPGEESSYEYYVKVKELDSSTVKFYARGDLNESIKFGEEVVTLTPGKWTKFEFKIKFPNEKLAPGLHENRLGIVEYGSSAAQGISIFAGVETKLMIRVPFEGRYLELKSFEISRAEVNKPVEFYAKVVNRGQEDINSAVLKLEIKNSQDEVVGDISTESATIKVGEEVTLKSAEWQTDMPGSYSVSGLVLYDDNILNFGAQGFRVGDILLKIENLSAPSIVKGEISQVYFDVRSFWNANIEDVYADLEVKDQGGKVISRERSPTTMVRPWDKTPMMMYWDSKSENLGDYEAKVTLHYSGKTDEAEVIIHIKRFLDMFLSEQKTKLITAAIIMALILFLLLCVLFIKKKRKRKEH